MSNEMTSGFYIESAASPEDAMRRLRPMSDLAEIDAVMNEIAERAHRTDSAASEMAVGTINSDKVWARYNAKKAVGL